MNTNIRVNDTTHELSLDSRLNADVRDVDLLFVGQPDAMTPLESKGIKELAITGMAAAIADAVYHATGTR